MIDGTRKISTARAVPQIRRDLAPLGAEELQDEESYEGLSIVGREWTKATLKSVRVQGSVFEAVDLSGAAIVRGRLSDCRYKGGSLAAARWEAAAFDRVEIIGCRATGLTLSEADLRNILFRECQLDLVQFRLAKLRRVAFERCSMKEADFYGASLSDVVFAGCDLSAAELSQAKVTNMDLRTSIIEGIRLGPETLRGSVMEPAQVLSIAHLLGIRFE